MYYCRDNRRYRTNLGERFQIRDRNHRWDCNVDTCFMGGLFLGSISRSWLACGFFTREYLVGW